MNGDIAAQNIATASHGRKITQLIDMIVIAVDSDIKMLPYNGCCGFGNQIAKNGMSPKTTVSSSDVQIVEKNRMVQPMNRNAHECNFRS